MTEIRGYAALCEDITANGLDVNAIKTACNATTATSTHNPASLLATAMQRAIK